jgi:hypothetical protein
MLICKTNNFSQLNNKNKINLRINIYVVLLESIVDPVVGDLLTFYVMLFCHYIILLLFYLK